MKDDKPVPAHLQDDGVPVGTYSFSHNMGGTYHHEVIHKIDDLPRRRLCDRYEVVLEVKHDWQARAIAAILNAE